MSQELCRDGFRGGGRILVEARRNICGDSGNDGGEGMGQMQELVRRGFWGEDGVWSARKLSWSSLIIN